MSKRNFGYYSLGLTGYEVWDDPDAAGERMMVLFVGTQREQRARSYKIQTTAGGRAFVRPNGRRVYLDECIRSDI